MALVFSIVQSFYLYENMRFVFANMSDTGYEFDVETGIMLSQNFLALLFSHQLLSLLLVTESKMF